ncbi:MAG: PilZ domain-containing protein [Elusimicrobia bacterium]|nr:PilZ domain-containing protein [Elusimicrobiota bacterium]
MSHERRRKKRFLTDLNIVLGTEVGLPLDDRAIAHDVSVVGFKLQTRAQLTAGTKVTFTLEIAGGKQASGRGLVVWSTRDPMGSWAGVKILRMPWRDKRLLSRLINADGFDWESVIQPAITATFLITLVAACQRLFQHPGVVSWIGSAAPRMLAVALMAWAGYRLLRGDSR